ncbi:hypothetical protein AB833_10680 [Chromatiales bacterium (ex Bugula neritina AB1)]|nr:hypothetical protein AB833_10680 [Chromatiales bacterium (ex Bugula neritina AB1)]
MAEKQFVLNTSTGELSATLNASSNATHTLLLAHGAGADHRHAHMASLACAFEENNIATLRFNFPFKQAGRNRVDSKSVATACVIEAADYLKKNLALPVLIGGHSFGGRMATHAVAEYALKCKAMILCSFPLHPAGKPATDRADHLKDVSTPMLFLSGTRDKLGSQPLLDEQVRKLGSPHQIHWLDTGDHSFKILKRSRHSEIDIYTEAAEIARQFIDAL